MPTTKVVLYECGICGAHHLWNWNGDCREHGSRIADPDEYATSLGISSLDIEVREWDERVQADAPKPNPSPRRFFSVLSGKFGYSVQWQAWEALCRRNGAQDADAVLNLLIRARESTIRCGVK